MIEIVAWLVGAVVVITGVAWCVFVASGSGTGTKSGEIPWEVTPQAVIEQMVSDHRKAT